MLEISSDDNHRALADALATSDVLARVAGTVAIHLYEMEMQPKLTVCNTFIGAGLESLLGPLPTDRTPEEAWEDAVHPATRAAYDATYEVIERGEACEVEYRLNGYDGRTRWVRTACTHGAPTTVAFSSTGSSSRSQSANTPPRPSPPRSASCNTSHITIP